MHLKQQFIGMMGAEAQQRGRRRGLQVAFIQILKKKPTFRSKLPSSVLTRVIVSFARGGTYTVRHEK